MLRLQRATVAAILRHAERTPNAEVCGLVWRSEGRDRVVQLTNCHADPARYYVVDPGELADAYADMDRGKGHPLAFYHSHPGGKPDPSEQDMLGAMNVGMHYLIAYHWKPETDKDLATWGVGPVWRLSAWHCLDMQILVEDQYEVRS